MIFFLSIKVKISYKWLILKEPDKTFKFCKSLLNISE